MAMKINKFGETIVSEMIQIGHASKVSEYEKYTIIIKSELCFDILLL